MKCERSNHHARNCKAPSRAKTPASLNNANQELVQKKMSLHWGHLKITELGSEEDSGNELEDHHQLLNVLLNTHPS